jgi:hypothetical protein
MLDVHAPHVSIQGWRDFLLHILTITIGLFIALSLEGSLSWLHRRHLVREAEANMQSEIHANANALKEAAADIHHQQEALAHDVSVLNEIIKTGKTPQDGGMQINFHLKTLNNLSWKTAQSTDALSLMSYDRAKEYAEIYNMQETFDIAEKQAVRDAILSLAPFMNLQQDTVITPAEADAIKRQIEILQAQLLLLDSTISALDRDYNKFLAAGPE